MKGVAPGMLRCATSLEADKPGSASESRAKRVRGELKSSRRDSCAEPFSEQGLYGRHLEAPLRARNGVKTSSAQKCNSARPARK